MIKLGQRIANSYLTQEQVLIKSEEALITTTETLDLRKGKPAVPVGTKKEISGRMYIKTLDGWKYFGKGLGAKAKEHHGKASAHAGGGSPIKPGSKITAAGVTGTVKHHDEKETHIEYEGKDGTTKLSKMKTDDVHAKIAEGKHEHAIPAHESGAVGKEDDGEAPKYDINKRFKAFELYTKAVIQGKMKSMIAYGSGGVGKTFTVTKELEAAGKEAFNEDGMVPGDEGYDYVKITGKSTPTAVWKELYQHNGKILIFDDNDAVLQNPDAINFFKGALDTSGDGTISYGTAKKLLDDEGNELPKRFKFTGRVIFISNLPPDKVPQPLKSRGYNVDLTMDKDQTMERLKHISTSKEGKLENLKFPGIDKYSHEDMAEVLDHLSKVKDKMHADLSVRTIGSMLGIKQMSDEMGEDWKEHASHMLFSKGGYDGEFLMKAQRINLLKSYGCDLEKAVITKNSDVSSCDYRPEAV